MSQELEVIELADWTPDVGVIGDVGVRTVMIEPGQVHPGHKHNYPHATHVDVASAEGVEVTVIYDDGREEIRDYFQGDWLQVPAEVRHQLRNLSKTRKAVCLCVFAARDKNGELVDLVTDEIRRDRSWHKCKDASDGDIANRAPRVSFIPHNKAK